MKKTNIDEVISELVSERIIPDDYQYHSLLGGTISTVIVILINGARKYVVKSNKQELLKAEVEFYRQYANSHFPNLYYVDPHFRFIVYNYMSGENNPKLKDKKSFLCYLAQHIINNYKQVNQPNKWGWLDDPEPTMQSFLFRLISEEKNAMEGYLSGENYNLIWEIIKSKESMSTNPFLLHGDLGLHNILFQNEQFVGVIDPSPVYGEPIYDLVYAFCSMPDDLSLETIQSATSLLNNWKPKKETCLHEYVLLGLFCRIGICNRRHPRDLPKYLSAWELWKSDYIQIKRRE